MVLPPRRGLLMPQPLRTVAAARTCSAFSRAPGVSPAVWRAGPQSPPFVFRAIGGTQRCMEKEAVEAKTQRFQQKLDRLRPVLEDRKKAHEQKKAGRRLKNGAIGVGLGLAGLAFVAIFIYQPPLPSSPDHAPPSSAVRPAVSEMQEKPAAVMATSLPATAPAEEPSPPPTRASSAEAQPNPPPVATLSFTVPPAGRRPGSGRRSLPCRNAADPGKRTAGCGGGPDPDRPESELLGSPSPPVPPAPVPLCPARA